MCVGTGAGFTPAKLYASGISSKYVQSTTVLGGPFWSRTVEKHTDDYVIFLHIDDVRVNSAGQYDVYHIVLHSRGVQT